MGLWNIGREFSKIPGDPRIPGNVSAEVGAAWESDRIHGMRGQFQLGMFSPPAGRGKKNIPQFFPDFLGSQRGGKVRMRVRQGLIHENYFTNPWIRRDFPEENHPVGKSRRSDLSQSQVFNGKKKEGKAGIKGWNRQGKKFLREMPAGRGSRNCRKNPIRSKNIGITWKKKIPSQAPALQFPGKFLFLGIFF